MCDDHGGLATVAERMAATHAFRDDVESIARALRRLRARTVGAGGKWCARLLAFALPRSVESRLRFMGSYHSRLVDVPVALCADLIQLWDRPPTSEGRSGRTWLSLARAIVASRRGNDAESQVHLATAAAAISDDDPVARAEVALGRARFADDAIALDELAPIDALIERAAASAADDAACLRARWVGQVGYAFYRQRDPDRALALHETLPDDATTPAFARSRRANGLAYGKHVLGNKTDALEHARLAAPYAGDAGHVRLRAMALLMIVRIAGATNEGREAHARAAAIARELGDDVLARRCATASTRL